MVWMWASMDNHKITNFKINYMIREMIESESINTVRWKVIVISKTMDHFKTDVQFCNQIDFTTLSLSNLFLNFLTITSSTWLHQFGFEWFLIHTTMWIYTYTCILIELVIMFVCICSDYTCGAKDLLWRRHISFVDKMTIS